MKICFAASSGGHLEEIACLHPIAEENDSFLLTEQMDNGQTAWGDRVYYLRQINRKERFFVFHFLKILCQSAVILIKEKPDYIISTGALVAYPICLLAKPGKTKVIYIESFARVDEASLTGRLMRPIADLFLVQWEDMLEIFPDSTYAGGIF